MFKKLYVLVVFFMFCFNFIFSQKKIIIEFTPELNKEYKYKTKSLIKINNDAILMHNICKTSFIKEKNIYKTRSEFETFEVINRDELLFSLQKELNKESNNGELFFTDFLKNENFNTVYDEKGNIIEAWSINSINHNEYLAEDEKEIITKLFENFNQGVDPFYLNKEFIVGEEFKINNSVIISNLNSNTIGKLAYIKDNKAIFKIKANYYTAIRDRNRNIIEKKANNFEAVLSLNITSGILHQFKFIFESGDTNIVFSSALDGDTFTEPSAYKRIRYFYKDKGSNVYLNPELISEDSLRIMLAKKHFKTKESAISKIKNSEFLSINRNDLGYHKNCFSVVSNLNLLELDSNMFVTYNKLKAYNKNNELLLSQNLGAFQHDLINHQYDKEISISYDYCNLKTIDYIEIDATIKGYYGAIKEVEISDENSKEYGVNRINKNEIEISNSTNFHLFKNRHNNNLLSIKSIKTTPFSRAIKEEYNLKDLTLNDVFLYSNVLENNKDGFSTFYFEEDVYKIVILVEDQKVEINKTFKLLN
ncbi:hypothetical protein QSV08_02640 [Maribacter sp. BPC-D8]|uniref:hypothetical protein n=1 Tax=Maribacter sp. BPC-D8 TaxID=3053613 RepID=UPI002B49CC55|nr:hypothetical protein [Maribacter sp. BPC-D8]WRI30141.1 hypothetical protein QSV08_02640 [Maribacter sp. BPC-D8]